MQKEKSKEIFFAKKLRNLYFSQLISINEQVETSFLFAILLEILRFILGHSLIYCLFMVENLDNSANGSLIISLRNILLTSSSDSYQWPQLICICLLFVLILYISMFCLKQKVCHKINTDQLLYYIGNFMKVASQFCFCVFAIVFYTSITDQNYFMMILVVLEMSLMLVLFKVSAIYQQKNKFQTDDLHSHNQNFTSEIVNLLFCIICIIGPFFMLIGAPQFIRIVLIIAWITLQVIRMKNTVIYPYYQHELIQKMYASVICLQTAQIVIHTLIDFIELQMLKNNALPTIAVLTIFLIWGVVNFWQSLVERSYFFNVEDIKSNHALYLLINSYYSALESLQKSDNLSDICLIVSSIRRNHQNTCKNVECYCYKQSELKNFLKAYLYEILMKLEGLYSHNQSIMLYIYSFKFHVFHNYAKIYQQVETLQKLKEMNCFETFLSLKLKNNLRKWIEMKNKEHKVIPICMAIRLEQDLVIINDIIVDDIEIKYKKWSTLSKQLSRIDEVRNMSNKEIQNLIKIETFKFKKWENYRRSVTFNLILYFYFKKILLKNSDLADLEQNIKELSRKVKEQQFGRSSLFSKYLFHSNACTVECSIKEGNLGMIVNTSKSVSELFGYSSRRIIGENMSCLIPHFLVDEHNSMMKQWATNGSRIEDISKAIEVYCQHKQNFCFVAQKYMKIYTGQDDITLNTTFFKRNERDLILINNENQLQCYGETIQPILKNIPNKIECDYVFKGMKNKIANADFAEQKHQKTFIFNQTITNGLLNNSRNDVNKKKVARNGDFLPQQSKQLYVGESKQQTQRPNQQKSQNKIDLQQSILQYDNIWKLFFAYKKIQYGNQIFFKIEVKGLEHLKKFQDFTSNKDQKYQIGSEQNHGIPSISGGNQENDAKLIEIGQNENSSMASYSSQLGYGISKLISHFSFILLNPSKLMDKRLKRKYFLDFSFTFLLISILFTTMIINNYSMQERTTSLKAKASIDKVLHLLQVSTSHVYTMYMYRNDPVLKQIIIDQSQRDQQRFYQEIDRHLLVINEQITFLQGEVLFDYLQRPVNVTFPKLGVKEIQILEFFKIFFYLFKQIREQMSSSSPNITKLLDSYNVINLNDQRLRSIRQGIAQFTENKNASNGIFNRNYLIITLILFFFISGFYAFYINNHRCFRFHQTEDHIKLYQMIPHEMLKNLNEYYLFYYRHFVLNKNKIDSCLNEENKLFQKQFEENCENQQLVSSNKIKLIGKGKYWIWMGILFTFLLVNGGNCAISYNMYSFNQEIDFFSKLANQLSASQSILLTRWIRLKSIYYMKKSILTPTYIDLLLSFIETGEVMFDSYSTFPQNWITESDPTFRQEFNQILTKSPCDLNKHDFTSAQIDVCNRQSFLSKNGIITFVNSFSRSLRNTLLHWKADLKTVLNKTDALIIETQFREVDLVGTFHVNTFLKLYSKIGSVYENGFKSQYQTYFSIFICIVLLIAVNFVWNIYNSLQEKIALSYMYGYVLLFPSSTLKHSKYLLKFIQNNLEFSEKH